MTRKLTLEVTCRDTGKTSIKRDLQRYLQELATKHPDSVHTIVVSEDKIN